MAVSEDAVAGLAAKFAAVRRLVPADTNPRLAAMS